MCLIDICGNGANPYTDEEIEIYAKVFNLAPPYFPRHRPREVLNVEVQPSNEDKKSAPMLELKPLASYLRYEFVGPNRTFPIVVSANLNSA